jgi:parallel beta-helix repeat protein
VRSVCRSIRFGNGILVGAGNLVEDNQAHDNFASGVAISGNANTINNTASGNAIAPRISGRTTFDLKDFRPDCGTNRWRANSFVTADPECTKR